MDKIIDYLKQLDLSDVEAKLYLTLLQTGPASVRNLAATIDIKRTTAYLYIDQLINKGLIIKIVKGSKKILEATEPENLENLVKLKLENAKEVQKNFPSILKLLNTYSPKDSSNNEAEMRYYKGKSGVKKIYEEALQANEIRSYVNIEEIAAVFPNNFKLFDNANKLNPGIKIYEICADSPQARSRLTISNKNHVYKILPSDMELISQDVLMYNNKVAIIHLKDTTSAVVLHNIDIYNNFKLLFDFLWKVLPK